MQCELVITLDKGRATHRAAPDLPVAAMLLGRPVDQAVTLLPRLFNLCGCAQGMAFRLSLGLPLAEDMATEASREVLRDHLARFLLQWPARLDLPPRPLPADWANNAQAVQDSLIGGPVPQDIAGFTDWLAGDAGVAPVMRQIAQSFAPGEAVAHLPLVTPERVLEPIAVENSVAARHVGQPVLAGIEAKQGRGPLWHAAGRLFDALDAAAGRLPAPVVLADRTVIVPAARGYYALRARAEAGIITGFERRTPTDHLCAAGGALEQALASLRDATPGRVALLADILDPCVPVTVREVTHA